MRPHSKSLSQSEFDLLNLKSQIGKGFGGARLKGHPKKRRPFSRKHLIHLILKSSKATGSRSMLSSQHEKWVNRKVRTLAQELGVEVREFVNVGNHLHILIKCSHRNFLRRFLRALCGVIARRIMKCEKGRPLGESFWDGRPYTKIIARGKRHFHHIRNYFQKNRRQAQGTVEGFDLLRALNTS